uniref:G_PROTEIN_RECEP_F2_4 domain-containing protein n=1 Tax=Heterorhabditis bacteriophora TaxID=37862 RepID=A0A1I7X701_HETBA
MLCDLEEVYESPCFCHIEQLDENFNYTVKTKLRNISTNGEMGMQLLEGLLIVLEHRDAKCMARGGEAVGLQCHFKPDVYMLSVLLTFSTFALACALKKFRHSPFFESTLVPLPVLIGIFLYMGVVSLLGQQFVQRIALLFMSVKHQLVVMIFTRMFILDKLFTKVELLSLDDILPSFKDVMQTKGNKLSNQQKKDEELSFMESGQRKHPIIEENVYIEALSESNSAKQSHTSKREFRRHITGDTRTEGSKTT